MQVIISGRHVSVTKGMKQYCEEKLRPLLDHTNLKISTARVILNVEKERHFAEIIVSMKHHTIEADAETLDMYQSIDKVVDKIDRQIRKIIDKVQHHHHDKGFSLKTPQENIDDDLYLELADEFMYDEQKKRA